MLPVVLFLVSHVLQDRGSSVLFFVILRATDNLIKLLDITCNLYLYTLSLDALTPEQLMLLDGLSDIHPSSHFLNGCLDQAQILSPFQQVLHHLHRVNSIHSSVDAGLRVARVDLTLSSPLDLLDIPP